MFEAKVKSEVLKEVIELISTLVDEAKFNMGKGGITLKAVDPAHVALIDLTLDDGAFDEYRADEGELGVDIDKVKEVLKLAKSGEPIEMRHDENKNMLIFNVGNITRRMALVDTAGMTDPKIPNLDLPSKVTIKTSEISRGIRAAESISDHIALLTSPDGFEMTSSGDTDSVDLKMPKDLLDELDAKEGTRSLFPLDYFSNLIKAISTAETVTLYLGTDYPVKIEFEIAGAAGHVRYLLAPRIESD